MKVVFVPSFPFSFLPPGGAVRQVLETKRFLEELGVEVCFWDPAKNYATQRLADIFHVFSSDFPLGQLAMLVKNLGYPYVVSTIFYPQGRIKQVGHRLLSRVPLTQASWRLRLLWGAELLLPNSKAEAKLLGRLFGLPDSRFVVVPNAVNPDFLGKDPDGFRRKYLSELPVNEPFVLSVALIGSNKNTLRLVGAAADLGVPLVLIGSVIDRAYWQRIEDLAYRKRVFLKHLGHLPHETLADAYAAAHVHALVSFMETPGIASLEAGLNGANLVVSSSPPVLEYLGQHAWVANPKDLRSIRRALELALNAPRDAKGASEFIARHYSWRKAAERTLHAYKRVLSSRGAES